MLQLPRAGDQENNDLCDAVPNCTRVRLLAQVTEGRLPFSLKLLLPPNILELEVQIADALCEIGYVSAIVFGVTPRRSNDDIEIHSDVVAIRKPVTCVICRKTDGMIACIVRREGKAAFMWPFSFDYCVSR